MIALARLLGSTRREGSGRRTVENVCGAFCWGRICCGGLPRWRAGPIPDRSGLPFVAGTRLFYLPRKVAYVFVVQQLVTRRTQAGEVFRVIRTAVRSWDDMMNMQILRVTAPWALASVAMAGQDFAPGCRGDGGRVALAGSADLTIALDQFQFRRTKFQLALAGWHDSFFALWTLVDVDLNGWFAAR